MIHERTPLLRLIDHVPQATILRAEHGVGVSNLVSFTRADFHPEHSKSTPHSKYQDIVFLKRLLSRSWVLSAYANTSALRADFEIGRMAASKMLYDVEKRSPPTPRIQSMSLDVVFLHLRAESVQSCPGKNAIHQLSRKPPEYRLKSPCRRISTTHVTPRQVLCTILSTRNTSYLNNRLRRRSGDRATHQELN
jgi:hypothetical protein